MAQLRFVVCGDDPLAHSLVDELTSRYEAHVTVILADRRRNHGPQLAALPRVRIVESERLDADAFEAAKLHRASGLALVQQDEVGNIHAALRAQELHPGIRLVIRMFNMSLGHGVRRLFQDCSVLSDASMAAPELVAAALGEVAPNFIRLPGRTLYVARRADVHPQDVVCGIAATDADHPPELLPADDRESDLVLAVANRRRRPARFLGAVRRHSSWRDYWRHPTEPEQAPPLATDEPESPADLRELPADEPESRTDPPVGRGRVASLVRAGWRDAGQVGEEWFASGRWQSWRQGRWAPSRRREKTGDRMELTDLPPVPAPRQHRRSARRRRRFLAIPRALLSLVDSKLEIATVILGAIFVGGVVAIGLIDNVTPWDALYTTVITAADAGDPDLQMGLVRQLTHAAVAVAGIAMVPVLTATVVNAAVNARLASVVGRLRTPISGHLVVIGLGNVGTRVIRMLHELGHEVVAIDKSESARGVRLAEELDIPLIIGDASEEETLRQASVRTCDAVLALSTSDVTNLEAALHARTLQPGLRVVMRLFDGDLAKRVERAFNIPISRSVSSLAAPAFAAALLEREVIGMIAVRRRVLIIAEVLINPGASLAGARVSDISQTGELRVITLTGSGDPRPRWMPASATKIQVGDRLTVIANRTGLSRVLARSGSPPPAEGTAG